MRTHDTAKKPLTWKVCCKLEPIVKMTEHLQNMKYTGQKIDDFDTFDILPDYLKDFYLNQNGFIAFNGGFHFRGCVEFPKWHSLKNVLFGDMKLSSLFDSVEINDIPFGQDCFGDQYLIRNNNIWRLSAETDEIENLGLDFQEFLKQIYCNPIEFLNIENIDNLTLNPGQLINVVPPFCIEAENGYSFKPIDTEEQILYLSNFSKQIKDLPNDTIIEFKTR